MSPLRIARQKQGLTIYQVAKKAGVRAPTVSRIERGSATTPRTAERLAKAIGISEEKVLYPDRFHGSRRKRKAA